MERLILIGITSLFFIFSIFSLKIAYKEHKERKEKEKELKNVKDQEEKKLQIISEANKTKKDARTGNISDNLHYMADKLHQWANSDNSSL